MLSELIASPEYQDWQWELSTRIRGAIENAFANNTGEVPCVEAIVRAVAGNNPVRPCTVGTTQVQVEAESVFLHGSRSQVKFSIGGGEHQCELADLLVLGSFVEDRALRWQRACLIQAKQGGKATSTAPSRFDIDQGQLALLRAFPEFEGLPGSFLAGLRCHLRNRSAMLGAYGLLAHPGAFTVISARLLAQILGGRHSIPGRELTPAITSEFASSNTAPQSPPFWWWPFDPGNCPECRHVFEYLSAPHWHHWQHHSHEHGAHGPAWGNGQTSALSCLDVDEFVRAWTILRLGEVWRGGAKTAGDVNLREALFSLVSRVALATGGLSAILALMRRASGDHAPPAGEDSPDGGGLAILSVIVSTSPPE